MYAEKLSWLYRVMIFRLVLDGCQRGSVFIAEGSFNPGMSWWVVHIAMNMMYIYINTEPSSVSAASVALVQALHVRCVRVLELAMAQLSGPRERETRMCNCQ
jgi:hypothetical protein